MSQSALRTPRFTAFFVAAAISNAAGWMQTVAVPALLFDLTHQSTWLGLATVANIAPAVLLATPAGVLSDRVDRRLILLATQLLQLAAATVLWWLYHTDQLTPGRILLVGFVGGVATGFQSPTWQAFIPSLVPQEAMLDAVRLNTLQFTLARAVGPAAAGVVVKQWGISWAIGINAVTYVLPVVVLLIISTPRNAVMGAGTRALDALRDGARYVWRERGLRLVVLLSLLTATLGQSFQFIAPAISKRIFGHSSEDNSTLLAALGVGGLVAALFARRLISHRARLPHAMTAVLALYAVTPLLVAATSDFRVGVAGYFLGGMAHVINAVSINAFIQSYAPDHLRGRVMSFYLLAILGGIQVGTFLMGWLGDRIGMRATVLVDAAAMTVISAWLVQRGALRVLGEFSPDSHHEGATPGVTVTA